MILPLVPENDPILFQRTDAFDFESLDHFQRSTLVEDMFETMAQNAGIGLAAPQVGRSLRMFVMRVSNRRYACFNPEIVWESDEREKEDEGCLSFPDLFMKVDRPVSITVRFQDVDGSLVNERFENLVARCYAHELDHLNGITFTKRVGPMTLKQARVRRSKYLKKDH